MDTQNGVENSTNVAIRGAEVWLHYCENRLAKCPVQWREHWAFKVQQAQLHLTRLYRRHNGGKK